MNLSAIFSKTGKGVQEASGKTSHLSRADRAVLAAIDGKTPLSRVQENFEKLTAPKFEALIQQLDKDGFIREVSSGAAAAPTVRPAPPPSRSAPPPSSGGSEDDMDFTQAVKLPPKGPAAPKAPPVDLAAAGRADAERKAKEAQATDYKAREEAETRAKAEAELKARAAQEARLKAEAEAKARAEAEAKARSEAEAKARADADSKTRAEADAKVKAAREAAVRMATEAKAKAEADAKAKTDAAERDKAKLEAELNAKLDAERKAREDAERRASEAAGQARKELEEKSKRDAEEMRQRLEAEMKAKLEAERKAREEEDRKRREEDDRRRKEDDERRAKEEAERRAREAADRKAREEEDRKRREDDERRRKEDNERRAKEDAERKAREEEDRKRRKEEDERRVKEEAERRAKDDAERRALEDTNRKLETEKRAREEAERKARDEADRKARDEAERRAKDDAERKAKDDAERRGREEAEAKARAAAAASASLPSIQPVAPPPPPAAGGGIADSLLADLDSFGQREEEEQKAKEEAERKAKEERARREKEEAERKAKEEAEKKKREEEERRRKDEAERREKEEAERKEREEEERRKEEEAERKRKAKEALAAKQAEERAAKAAAAGAKPVKGGAKTGADDDDIGVTDADLDLDDLKRDQKVAAEKARKAAREAPTVAVAGGRPKKWGKPAAIALFVLLIAGLGVLHVMPLSTAEYEKAASDAMGVPVKIGSARLSVITGIEVKLEGVSIGSAAKIRLVRGSPEVGSLFGARKSFSRVELEGVSMTQAQLGDALLGKAGGENLRISRIVIKQLVLEGPLKLPPMDMEAMVGGDGTLQTVKLTGADKLSVTLTPRNGEIGFDISAGSLAVPFVPALSLSEFAMKGSANATGVTTSEFDGRVFDGVLKGSARIRWGASWNVDGEIRAVSLKAAVFAPTLVSDGRVEGRAAYSMAGSAPASLYESARLQGEFKIEKGVIGSFDLSRAMQTGGASTGGRTVFNELTGQGLYDKGVVQISNATISAGAMNAGMSLNIDVNGGLSGRVVADVKTPSQTLRSTLNISGKVQEPVIRK